MRGDAPQCEHFHRGTPETAEKQHPKAVEPARSPSRHQIYSEPHTNIALPTLSPRSGPTPHEVPKCLPLAVFLQLLDPAQDQIPLQPAQAFDEQNALQMIDLMLHAPSQQLRTFDLEGLAVHALRPHP